MTHFTTYHVDPSRSGLYTGTASIAEVSQWRKYRQLALGAPVRGAPLFLSQWAFSQGSLAGQKRDVVIVATSDNLIEAYDDAQLRSAAATVAPIWSRRLGAASRRPSSNIPPPVGICSTPVIDTAARRLYALALRDDGGREVIWDICANTSNGLGQGINFGNLTDGHHHFWIGDFSGSGREQVLFYYEGDGNWWLGEARQFINWRLIGNTLGHGAGNPNFGQVGDGRPFWTGDFSGSGRAEILFYFPGDGNWWLGRLDPASGHLGWSLAGNTLGHGAGSPNFGQVWDGRPFWIGDFSGGGRAEVLFYFPGDGNWWLAHYDSAAGHFGWRLAGNTLGHGAGSPNFGQVWDGRPFWIGDFSGGGRAEVLFYFPGDGNWWLAHYDSAAGHFGWRLAGNTLGHGAGSPNFGQVWDGRPFWTDRFSGAGKNEVLFYFPGDGNWWLGTLAAATGQFGWRLVSNTLGHGAGSPNFGQVADGKHHFWAGSFTGSGRADLLFYYEGDHNWWLSEFNPASGKFAWTFAGNRPDLGQVYDGRPFWTGHFTGTARREILFYYPGNGDWWLGGCSGSTYQMHALDLDTGALVASVPLHDAGAAGRPRFDSSLSDQRGALNLVNGRVYATFADYAAYDIGPYHGWVVSCDTADLTRQHFFAVTRTVTGGGVWGPGGAAADPSGNLFIATGNGANAGDAYWQNLNGRHPGDLSDFFEAVVRLSPDLAVQDWYIPTNAKQMNDADQDLGGSSPIVLPPIGGRQLVVVTGKDADVYLLDRTHLGHWGGELWRFKSFANESKCAPARWLDSAGTHFVFVVGGGAPGLIAYRVVVTAGGAQLQQAWTATGGLGDYPGSPLVMTGANPTGTAVVWIVDDTVPALRGFDAATGNEVFNSSRNPANALGAIAHFPPISCGTSSAYVGTATGLACYGANFAEVARAFQDDPARHSETI